MAVVQVVRRVANPARRRKVRRPSRLKRNPALAITLGTVNPKRRKHMNPRRKRRKKNPRRRTLVTFLSAPRRRRHVRRARQRNPVVVTYRRRGVRRRRRNPLFERVSMKMVGGGLVGVAATRLLGNVVPTGLLSFAGSAAPLLRDGIAAVIVSWGSGKVVERQEEFNNGVAFGALMQVASTAIQTFFPGLRQFGFGIGQLMPAQFPVPQNPLKIPAPVAAPAAAPANGPRVTASGLSRAFGPAL